MRRRCPVLRAALLAIAAGTVSMLLGCDRSLSGQDPFSPMADVRVTSVTMPAGVVLAPILKSSSDTPGSTGTVTVDYPEVGVNVSVFNGVSVTFTGFRIQYFRSDGATSLGLSPMTGALTVFLAGGRPSASDTGSIAPTPDSTGVVVGGIVSGTQLSLPAVSGALRSQLAGPDGSLGTADDAQETVVARISISGTDINANDFVASASISITTRPQISSGSGAQ